MNLKTKARRAAILNYVELNPGCDIKQMSTFWKITLKSIQRYLGELKKENQIKVDDSSKIHTYHRLVDDNETIGRYVEAKKFLLTQNPNTNLKKYFNVMKNILKSRPSLYYYVMLHYKAFADKQEKMTDEKLIDMPYSKDKSQQDSIIENYLKSYSLLTEIPKKISPEYKEEWIEVINQSLPFINAKPATLIPFTKAAKQFQEGNEQPLLDLREEWNTIEFNKDQEILFSFGFFQYFINRHRKLGKDVSRFEDFLNNDMGFFIYSPEDLREFAIKMNDYFECDANTEDFFLELGKKISAVKTNIYIYLQTEKGASNDKFKLFRKYKIYCLNNCFMNEDELWDGFLRENEKTLKQLKLKLQKTFVRAFNRWNEWIDFNELKQKIQILNMEGDKSLAYGY